MFKNIFCGFIIGIITSFAGNNMKRYTKLSEKRLILFLIHDLGLIFIGFTCAVVLIAPNICNTLKFSTFILYWIVDGIIVLIAFIIGHILFYLQNKKTD
ncbi:MAG: hypothetical protein ABH887_01620 [bacterium]